jgi:hypothetical protein
MTRDETNRRALGPVLLALALSVPATGLAQIYRSVMPDGSVVYSDSPPQGAAATDRLPDPVAPPAPSPPPEPVPSPEPSPGSADSWSAVRAQEIAQADAAVEQATRDLAAARRRYEEGKDPGEGDFVGMRGKGRGQARPSEAYLQRVEQLERDVADAQARLKAAQEAARLARMR